MIHADARLLESLGRLRNNHDFLRFLDWIKGSEEHEIQVLLKSVEPAIVHQAQGSALALRDIQRVVTSAKPTLG